MTGLTGWMITSHMGLSGRYDLWGQATAPVLMGLDRAGSHIELDKVNHQSGRAGFTRPVVAVSYRSPPTNQR